LGVEDFTIAVGTFGGNEWVQLATERAIPSAEAQGCAVVHRHGTTLAQARNAALAMVDTEWVVWLDADDELSSGYIEALAGGTADLRAPSVSYVKNGQPREACVPKVAGHSHECDAECIASGAGNWLVVGTAARAELLREVGGWRNWPIYEDFCLWLRAIRAGASVEAIPAAVYLAHWRHDSRNRAPDMAFKNRIHREILKTNLGSEEIAA
jgi:cellulose synthase/poly-beta-1,6-N-acetylglucosamine synthase-like glycosyltransferase